MSIHQSQTMKQFATNTTTNIDHNSTKSNPPTGQGFGQYACNHESKARTRGKKDHEKEWIELSRISEAITRANLITVEPEQLWGEHYEEPDLPELFYWLYPNGEDLDRRNDGRLTNSSLRKIDQPHLLNGGWIAQGYDIHTGKRDLFITAKLNSPRWDHEKGKYRKYEHPRGLNTRPLFPGVPIGESNNIARRHQCFSDWKKFLKNYDGDPNFAIWEFAKTNPKIELHITEGFKKAASLITQGYLAVGLPGIWNWIDKDAQKYINQKGKEKRRKELTRDLTLFFKSKTQKRNVTLWLDQDTKPATKKNVDKALEILGKAISKEGGKPFIATWNPEDGKGIDDVIFKTGCDHLTEIFNNRLTLSAWLYLFKIGINPDAISKQINKRYLEKGDINPATKFIGIKSEKGTGKTQAIKDYLNFYIRAGIPILVIAHRQQLAQFLADIFGIDSQYDIKFSQTQGQLGIAICVDSLHGESATKIDIENFDGIVVVDEAKQVFDHILTSMGTEVKHHRPEVCKNLTTLFQNARQVILSDADLSQTELDYANSLLGNVAQEVVVNCYKPSQGRKLYSYQDNESLLLRLLKQCEELVEAKEKGKDTSGMKILIPTDSQLASSKWSAQNLKALIEESYPTLVGEVLDSDTVTDPESKCYKASTRINELVKTVDFLVYTSVSGGGISIDVKDYFGYIFSFNQGTQSENSTRQYLARLRDTKAEIHAFFKKIGNNKIGGGENDVRQILASNKKAFKDNVNNLNKANQNSINESNGMMNHSWFYAQYIATHNLGMASYREIVEAGLKNEGFDIIPVASINPKSKKLLNQEVTVNRDVAYDNEVDDKEQIGIPTKEEYEKIADKQELTKEQRIKKENYQTHTKYGVDNLDKELIKENDKGLYSKIDLLFWLNMGVEPTKDQDNHQANQYIKKNKKAYFMHDFNKTQKSRKVEILNILKIPEMIALEGKEIHNDSPEVKQWWNNIEYLESEFGGLKDAVKNHLGLTISDNETKIRNLGKILGRVGYDLEKLEEQTARSETSDNKRHHKYKIQPQYSKQDQILAYWKSKFDTSDPFNLGEPQVELINYFNDSAITIGEKITKFNQLKDDGEKERLIMIAPYIKDHELTEKYFVPFLKEEEEQK